MKSYALLALAFALVAASNIHLNDKYADVMEGRHELTQPLLREIYDGFVSRFNHKGEDRFEIFSNNVRKMVEHNRKKLTWTQGINDFADLTFEEFKKLRLMKPQDCSATEHNLRITRKAVGIPASYEWNSFGVVTPVKDQDDCGSCWAFSTVSALESHWNILGKGKNITFSEQQLVDCAGDFENYGCDGGLPSQAFEYIKAAKGIESDITYPYTARDGSCVFRRSIAIGYAKYGSYNITEGDETELADRLYNVGPVSVSFEVLDSFQFYKSGVYSVPDCGTGTQDINHAVLATGYGTENGVKFWNIKNSWSTEWGVKGYFKIQRDVNMCAISQCNSYPLIDNDTAEYEEVKA